MLKTITPDEMKRLEENYMNRTGTSALQLMESAARHVADAAAELAGEAGGTVLCLCGPGSNGGDGLAAMRLLTASRPELRAVCWLLPGTLNDAAEHQLRRLQAEAPAVEVVRLTDDPLPSLPENVCCFVDSLFGTGLSRPLTGTALALCAMMNEHERVPTLAVDIPSGLDGTTGVILGCAVRADRTVTFHRPKPGLYRGYGLDFAGQVDVVSIGIPSDEGTSAGFDVLEPSDLRRLLPPRRHLSHKGTYGRVVLLAGSKGMAGAAAISAGAALRAGAGLVTVACPDNIWQIIQTLCPCATCLPLPEDDPTSAFLLLEKALNQADCLGMGCGLGQGPWAQEMVRRVLGSLRRRQDSRPLPTVVDADALNLLSHSDEGYDLSSCVRTPHPAEAARLLRCEVSQVLADQEAAARQSAAAIRRGHCFEKCRQSSDRQGGRGPERTGYARHGQGRQRRCADRRSLCPAGGPSGWSLQHDRSRKSYRPPAAFTVWPVLPPKPVTASSPSSPPTWAGGDPLHPTPRP